MAHVGKMLEDREKKATFMVKKNDDDKYTLVSTHTIISVKYYYIN